MADREQLALDIVHQELGEMNGVRCSRGRAESGPQEGGRRWGQAERGRVASNEKGVSDMSHCIWVKLTFLVVSGIAACVPCSGHIRSSRAPRSGGGVQEANEG